MKRPFVFGDCVLSLFVLICLLVPFSASPQVVMSAAQEASGNEIVVPSNEQVRSEGPGVGDDYVLGSGDRLSIHVFGADDFPNLPVEVGADGEISAPLVGRVKAAGLPLHTLQGELTSLYSAYFRSPDVSVLVADYRSQPVTVVGSVNRPGIVQLRRPTRLMEAISMAGGLRADAGDRVFITRRVGIHTAKDVTPASDTAEPDYIRRELDLRKIADGTDPSLNVFVEGNDLISVPKARMVYVVGDVGRPGAYVLDGHGSTLSVLQAIALAGGINKTAKATDAKILRARSGDGSVRSEFDINLKTILAAKSPDIPLHANDVLFVPNSAVRNAGLRTLQMAADIGTGLAIWRF